uniref:Transcriptional modulator of MazE/toxin, MazF n=1 Tax=Caulobacter sp. (strain K31) TaxID=366602 RepID=B0T5D1_CAUSK
MVRLDPTVGSEIQKTRPCVIVSPDGLSHLNTFIVVPMTTGSHPTRFRPEIAFDGKEGLLLPDQIRTVARARMIRRMGVIDEKTLGELLATLRTMFDD